MKALLIIAALALVGCDALEADPKVGEHWVFYQEDGNPYVDDEWVCVVIAVAPGGVKCRYRNWQPGTGEIGRTTSEFKRLFNRMEGSP